MSRDPMHRETTYEEYRNSRLISSSRSISKNKNVGHSTLAYKATIRRDDSDSDLSNSCSRSCSPIPCHHHRTQLEHFKPLYERPTMYDWTPKCLQEDEEYNRRHANADKNMRLTGFLDSSNSSIDLRLPYQPVKNIQKAKEIGGSMSVKPIPYKIYKLDVPNPKYNELRQSFKSRDTADPRLRRILGLPELSNSKAWSALGRHGRRKIASPYSIESSSSPTRAERKRLSASTSTATRPHVDPRRHAHVHQLPAGNPQQNIEIRLILQKSDWYKNLNSKAKIIVNQQLALLSTELKRYHQDPSPNKVFDIQFTANNQNLQKILTCLGIYIDDNGQVAQIGNDCYNTMMMGGGCGMGLRKGPDDYMDYGDGVNPMMMMNDPNMMQSKNFLRGTPPSMNNMMEPLGSTSAGCPSGQGMYGGPEKIIAPYWGNPKSGIGMPPSNCCVGVGGGVAFSQFARNPCENNSEGGITNPNFLTRSSNNPFSNNFAQNGENFNNKQMNRGNRYQNRYGGGGGGGGGGMINNGNIGNQNRRNFNQNRSKGSVGGSSDENVNLGKSHSGTCQNTADNDVEESWDD